MPKNVLPVKTEILTDRNMESDWSFKGLTFESRIAIPKNVSLIHTVILTKR
jgi:hypothetical protein